MFLILEIGSAVLFRSRQGIYHLPTFGGTTPLTHSPLSSSLCLPVCLLLRLFHRYVYMRMHVHKTGRNAAVRMDVLMCRVDAKSLPFRVLMQCRGIIASRASSPHHTNSTAPVAAPFLPTAKSKREHFSSHLVSSRAPPPLRKCSPDWSATRPVSPTDMDDSRGLYGLRSEQKT